jgi:hypothetical protein
MKNEDASGDVPVRLGNLNSSLGIDPLTRLSLISSLVSDLKLPIELLKNPLSPLLVRFNSTTWSLSHLTPCQVHGSLN